MQTNVCSVREQHTSVPRSRSKWSDTRDALRVGSEPRRAHEWQQLLYVLHILTELNVTYSSDLQEQKIDNILHFDLHTDTFDALQNSSAVGGSHTEKKKTPH